MELTPENADTYTSYFDVHLEDRDLDFLLSQVFVGIEEVNFGGQEAYSSFTAGSQWYIVPYQESIYVITTQTPELEDVQIMLESFKFTN